VESSKKVLHNFLSEVRLTRKICEFSFTQNCKNYCYFFLLEAIIFVMTQKRDTRKAFPSSRLLLIFTLRLHKTQIRTSDLLAYSELPAH